MGAVVVLVAVVEDAGFVELATEEVATVPAVVADVAAEEETPYGTMEAAEVVEAAGVVVAELTMLLAAVVALVAGFVELTIALLLPYNALEAP